MGETFLSRHGRRIVLCAVLFLLVGTAGYVGYSAYHYKRMTQEWFQPIGEEERTPIHAPTVQPLGQTPRPLPELLPSPKPLKTFTLLLIGSDSRDGERARADTMLLAVVRPADRRAYLISIPRDSYMVLPGRGYDKVNHALAYGGPKLLKRSLEQFFQVNIDRYMKIDFDGFRKIVDELGGVQIHVKKRMKYTDPTDNTYIDLYPGLQTLNGEQALDYVRYRKSDLGKEDSDYERIKRQQEVLQALAGKGETLQAFIKAFTLMEILGKHVKTDLSEEEIASLLATYYDPKQHHLEMDTLNGTDERIWRNGIRGWYYLVPKTERLRVQKRLMQEINGKQDGK
ncbi:LCP family protein [Brevibacillus sp. SYP-B805]|uniref:LCP family protein n=1 Tax=Brevibacillus sp. SYP-B805 TaxID=1578199 RepID=UPI0013EC9B75|nr:LCP family protein [Brevibacillus sp. SYP-B805]NGQ94421.1 LCP family protein [Brevibacillus sp. SYP-B805]